MAHPSVDFSHPFFLTLLPNNAISCFNRYGASPTSAQQYILDTLAPLLQVPVSSTACYRLNILQALLSHVPSLHDDMRVRLTGTSSLHDWSRVVG